LAREAKLVRHLIGSGVTALGRANYADGKGNYYVGFFGLSIGLERLAKPVLVADYAIENGGRLPPEAVVRQFGHNLAKLADAVDHIVHKHGVACRYPRPTDSISQAILECLDSFADAGRGRYVNFGSLGDPNLEREFEPIRMWWERVTEPILKAHFFGTAAETRVQARAHMVSSLMSPHAVVLFFGEGGEVIDDLEDASVRTGKTEFAQKYWRYYSLRLARWMSDVFRKLSHNAVYHRQIDVLFGHEEHFQTFTVDDSFLKTRKVWPL
jgi:hypothetical protein